MGLFRGGSSANPPRIRPGPRRTAAELIHSAESAADSASEIFIPPKKFFVGFRLGGDRTQSDFLGLSRTQSESAAELFRQLYYLHFCSSRKNFRGGRPFAAEILAGSGLGLGLGLGFRLWLWLRLGLGFRLGLGLEYLNPNPNPNPDPTIISAAEGRPRRKFLRGEPWC